MSVNMLKKYHCIYKHIWPGCHILNLTCCKMAHSVIELLIYATLKLSKVPEIADKQNILKKKL